MGKYFTIAEMVKSETADRRGIDNRLPKALICNVDALIDNVLDPLREAYGKPITVTSGYRCEALNKAVGGSKTSDHCFDDKTELLTSEGWKLFKDVSIGETIFSYSMERKKIELVPVESITHYHHKGKMVKVVNKHVDLCVTDQHRMLVKYEEHKYKRKGTRNISASGQAYFDSLKTENDKFHIETASQIFGKRRIMMCSAKSDGYINMTDDDIKFLQLCMAVVADGFITYRNGRFSGVGFRLKRERKIKHTLELINSIGIYHTERISSDGVFTIWLNSTEAKPIFEVIGAEKIIPQWILMLSHFQIRGLIAEYAFYDGSYDKREGCDNFSITSVNRKNVDTLQSMMAISGFRSSISIKPENTYNIRNSTGVSKEAYIINVCDTQTSKVHERRYSEVEYDGDVWCANNVNTTLIVRRNGKVSVQGNCNGMAADIVGTPNTKAENKRLFNLVQELGLPFTQLIDEKNFSWVHVSYDSCNVKKQILKL